MNDDLVVMLTALDLEYQAVRRNLEDPQLHRHQKGTRFEIGTISGTRARVALALVGKGNHATAVLAERAIDEFKPLAVLFVGVAGALRPQLELGDLIVATHVYAYHGGTSEDDGFKARPRVWEAPHHTDQLARHIARTGSWQNRLSSDSPHPTVHFGAIAAGEIVHDSRISYEAGLIREHYNDTKAVEMEAAGVAQAAHLNGSPVVVVRGISDYADGEKSKADAGNWQKRAATNAAAFAVQFADELIKEGRTAAMQEPVNPTGGSHTYNTSAGTVGIQAGQVTGSTVLIGTAAKAPTAIGVAADLAALRAQLTKAHMSGQLDEDTHQAAQAELDAATSTLAAEGDTSGPVVLALKRLRGLVADVAELAAKVAAVIAAIKGL